MDALKVRERYVREATAQVEIMENAARALGQIQDEMQGRIERAMLHPYTKAKNNINRLGWLVQLSRRAGCWRMWTREMGLEDKLAEALEALLSGEGQLWEQLPLFEDIARKASEVHVRCAANMDQTSATTRLVPKDRQRAYVMQALWLDDDDTNAGALVGPLSEGWHQETHNANGTITAADTGASPRIE
jgi:hypothetical protein